MSPTDCAIVDLRAADAHARARPPGAVCLAPEDLQRAYLLPPPERPLVLVGGTPAEIAACIATLRQAGRTVLAHHPEESWRNHFPIETGPPTQTRLWEPAAVVVRVLEAHAGLLPGNRGLDLACGSGRNAVYLALAGMQVTAVDILPDALEQARDLAARHATRIRTLELDLEKPGALDDIQADLVVVVRYLERSLFAAIVACLASGGILAYETFSGPQTEGRCRNPRFVLQPGELATAFPGLQVLEHETGFAGRARVARLIARRPV
jgi:tellurite methyltransferase